MSYLFPSSTITFEAALRDLAQGSPRARAAAAHALGDVVDPVEVQRAVEVLTIALDDDRLEVRAEACASLGELKAESALPPLIKRLDDGAPAVRQNAAIALGSIGHADGFAPLADALRDGPADLRFQAATSLAEIDTARAYDPLVAALGDRDPQVIGAAALALGAIGDARAIAHILPVIAHADAGARFDAAYALAELGDGAGRAVLVEGLGDEARAWDAVTALGVLVGASREGPRRLADGVLGGAGLGGADNIEALGRALANLRVPPEATILAAGTLLQFAAGSAYHDAARRVLLTGLGARKTHVRGLAVEQLGLLAQPWAKAPLEKLAASGKGAELLETIASSLRAIAEAEERGGA